MRKILSVIISFVVFFASFPVYANDSDDNVIHELGSFKYAVPSNWYEPSLDNENAAMYYCNEDITYFVTLMYSDWGMSNESSLIMASGIVSNRAKPGTSTMSEYEIEGKPFKYSKQVSILSESEYLDLAYILPVGDGETVTITLFAKDGASIDLFAVMGFHDLCNSIVLSDGSELGDVVSITSENQ